MKLRRVVVLMAALVFAFAVVACDNNDGASPTPAAGSPAAATPAAATSPVAAASPAS